MNFKAFKLIVSKGYFDSEVVIFHKEDKVKLSGRALDDTPN